MLLGSRGWMEGEGGREEWWPFAAILPSTGMEKWGKLGGIIDEWEFWNLVFSLSLFFSFFSPFRTNEIANRGNVNSFFSFDSSFVFFLWRKVLWSLRIIILNKRRRCFPRLIYLCNQKRRCIFSRVFCLEINSHIPWESIVTIIVTNKLLLFNLYSIN